MLKKQRFAASSLAALIGAAALLTTPSVHAERNWVFLFQDQYPLSLTDNNGTPDGCQVCHTDDNGPNLNPYGADWRNAWTGTTADELQAAFVTIQGDDSDNDPTGSNNITEINANTQPGFAEGDNAPGVIGLLDPAAPVPDIAVSPTAIDFGAVTVGTSDTANVNIANAGSAELMVNSLALSGSTDFSLPSAPTTPFTVAANTSVNVTVEYAPFDEGTDNGSLEIASDSLGEELVAVSLTGTGIPVVVEECVASVSPASIAFGSVEIDSTMTLSTTISNDGGASCTVNATVIDVGGFTLASASSFMLAPGGSADVDVTYAPAVVGDDSGQLVLNVASPADTITVPLSGSGIEAPVEVLDLDIKRFSVTRKISLTRVKPVVIKLTVNNGGVTEGSAPATVTGMQNGVLVHEQTLDVTDGVGNGSTRYTLDPFTPQAVGEIQWTMVIADGDPDDDVATATTAVNP